MDNSYHSDGTVILLAMRIMHFFPVKQFHAYKSHCRSSCGKSTHNRNNPSSKVGEAERLESSHTVDTERNK